MTPTSGCCRRADGAAGFTLLEMLVVLALVSIMVAVVAPRLAGTVRAIGDSGDRAETKRQLERLPLLARASGSRIDLPAEAPLAIDGLAFPEGWMVTALDPVRVAASGVCSGARVRVAGAGLVEEWTLSAPDCTVGDGS